MKLIKKAGATSEIWQVFIQDSSSTIGAGLTGLAFNTAGLTAYYHRDTDTIATAITLATMTVGTFTSSGFKEIDATNMPGWYQFCPPNAAIASGAKSCAFHLKGATNMAPLPIECQLTAVDADDAVRMGLTALPNAAAEAAGGLYTRGAGAGQIAQQANGQADVNVSTIKTQAVTCAAGVTVLASVGTAATSTAQTGDNFARLGAPAGASVSADVAAINAKTTNLPGSPAAVGSAMTLTSGERSSVADALLDRDMATGTDSGSPTVRTVRQALRALRNKWTNSAGTYTVYKEDDSTPSWTGSIGTDAAAVPIVSNDPA